MLVSLILAGIGMILKLAGGVLYGSRSVLIDGATCIGNIASGLLLYYSLHRASLPPDEDHPYGHDRFIYAGVLGVLIVYSLIAGASTAILYYSLGGYSVEAGAPVFALAGTLAYGLAIVASRRVGYAGSVFSGFTLSEVLEGLVTSLSSYLGYEMGYYYDLAGGLVILGYLYYELYHEAKRLTILISDAIDPGITRRIRRLHEERGLRVEKIRLRLVTPGKYQGDAVVSARMPYEVADLLADEVVEEARRMGVDLVVHVDVEPARRGPR
ncbi:MAG: cation transporter [Desulfurococcales archaeon]|nr:cation transporter [Desulfurococcales archaeon]